MQYVQWRNFSKEIDKNGKVVNHKLVNSVIHSKKKMTYEDLNTLFDGGEVDASYYPFLNDIKLLVELSDILSKNKKNRGLTSIFR